MSFILQMLFLALERCFSETMAVLSVHLLSLCGQFSSLPCENPFRRNETKQWKQTARGNQGSSGVNTRPDYYSSVIDKRKTPGCSPSDGSGGKHSPLNCCCFTLKSSCWNYLIYRNSKSQNGTDRWTCSRADSWPQEVLSEKGRSKPISSLV